MVFPASVLQSEFDALLGYLPLVRDGDVEGVHDARVVTRKLREALPLFARSFPDDVRRVKRIVKRAGRRLGRVRELDVMDAELTRRAGRMPLARARHYRRAGDAGSPPAAARRRLVKTLDRVRLDRRNQLRLQHRRDWWHPFDADAGDGLGRGAARPHRQTCRQSQPGHRSCWRRLLSQSASMPSVSRPKS